MRGKTMLAVSAAIVMAAAGAAFGQAGTPARDGSEGAPKETTGAPAAARGSTEALDAAHRAKAMNMIAAGSAFLRSTQDKTTGAWSAPTPSAEGKTQPSLPGITALAMMGLSGPGQTDADRAAVAMGIKSLLNFQQKDGGVYDRMLPSYNTSLAVSALARVRPQTPQTKAAVERGVEFLRQLQFGEASNPEIGGSEAPKKVEKDHPFYGGVGYGRSGRPDNSNLMMFMQALQDAGVSPEDEAVKRALVFLERTQMDDRVNSMEFAKGSRQGGFVYATVPDAESVDSKPGQSHAGKIEETLSDGTKASRLRAYGSMTYAGFKSYLYAQLPKSDQRVQSALGWIERNYTVDENPGMGSSGLYYYYVVFARALAAWGAPTVGMLDAEGKPTGKSLNWRENLIDKLATLQNEDGSFKSVDARWMENNPDLITAYALIALGAAVE